MDLLAFFYNLSDRKVEANVNETCLPSILAVWAWVKKHQTF
jgi:hypothetical protein